MINNKFTFTGSQYPERSGKGGTFPTRYSMKNSQTEIDDGKQQLNSFIWHCVIPWLNPNSQGCVQNHIDFGGFRTVRVKHWGFAVIPACVIVYHLILLLDMRF